MVYLDNAATTRVCPEAAEAAVHMMTECFGNPSTTYKLGREAKAAVDKARGQIAKALGCQLDEVYFTSCGSEGDNWALISGARYMRRRGRHIINAGTLIAAARAGDIECTEAWNRYLDDLSKCWNASPR